MADNTWRILPIDNPSIFILAGADKSFTAFYTAFYFYRVYLTRASVHYTQIKYHLITPEIQFPIN